MNCPCCGQLFPEEMADTDYDLGQRAIAEIKASRSWRERTKEWGPSAARVPYPRNDVDRHIQDGRVRGNIYTVAPRDW